MATSQMDMLAAGYNSGDPVRRAAALSAGYVAPATRTPKTTTAVANPLFNFAPTAADTEYDSALSAKNAAYAMADIPTSSDRRAATAQFQAQIDALNAVYAEQKRKAFQRGQEQLGGVAAVNARAGLLGSDFGTGNVRTQEAATQEVLDAIDVQKNQAIAGLYTQISAAAQASAAARVKAAQQGADAKLEEIRTRNERKQKALSNAAKAYLAANAGDISGLNKQHFADIAKQLGMSEDDVANAFNNEVSAYSAAQFEQQKAQAGLDKTLQDIEASKAGVALDREKFGLDQAKFGLEQRKLTAAENKEQASVASPYQRERAFRTLQSVSNLRSNAMLSPGIFGRTAALPVPDALRSDAFRNFAPMLDTLKSNIAFGELTAMREASKTGGALGQVSDTESRLLAAALGSLEMSQTPEAFVQQLDQIDASIRRWQQAVDANGITNTFSGKSVVTAPDGTLVELVD